MKVEIRIEDRQHWIEVVKSQKAYIEEIRKTRDLEYEKKWRKRRWLPDRPETAFPDKNDHWNLEYPSSYGRYNLFCLNNVERALETKRTGTILIDDDELSALRV